MKRILFLLFFLVASLSPPHAFARDVTPLISGSDAEAASVLNQYFGALVNGDVATLKTLLAGDLLRKRSRLLDNPDYPGYLSASYMNATLKILNLDTTDPDIVQIDALITFNQDERIRKRYTLKKSPSRGGGVAIFRIISERTAAGSF